MRQQQLQQWCNDYFKRNVVLQALSGDASFRRYFRIQEGEQSWIVADAPPQTEKNAEFVSIAKMLNTAAVKAPQVLHFNIEQGFLLLTDLGDQTLLPVLNEANVDEYYQQSLSLISLMQTIDVGGLDGYSKSKLVDEMRLFSTWFVGDLLQYPLAADELKMIEQIFQLLSDSALEQPQLFVHRDFHSRNLMLVDPSNASVDGSLADGSSANDKYIATIDFQDAVQGAITYDAVSLLRDCYIEWPQAKVETWLASYQQMCKDKGFVPAKQSFAEFKQWFDFMGLQRHLKVLGIFARLSIRDDKHGYLLDLPLVIKYTRDVLAMYPQQALLKKFLVWFDEKLLPRIEKQDWSKGREA